MSELSKLRLGVAYHSNRILHHVREDMLNIINGNMNTVVHMYTHNDMMRHKNVMRDIVSLSEDLGLEVWVDNWGIDGGPGDKGYFVSINPTERMIFSDGTPHPFKPCYNSEVFFEFTKTWIEHVREAGGKTIFWDEPHLAGDASNFTCCCPTCQKLFAERFGKPMPTQLTPEVVEFRTWSIENYFRRATAYARECGIINTVCVMFSPSHGISLDNLDRLASIDTLENIGCDPYWLGSCSGHEVYQYVYDRTKKNIDLCEKYHKDHNVWIQCYGTPHGREDEIILAAEAAYDAGARTIIGWSYRSGESNDYRAEKPDFAWQATCEAMRRLRNRHMDEELSVARAKYRK
ncbi:MAG: hypothetical protein IJF34_09715 [Clostridia bacterium]|nr:hypothetical protein [Clostridia bacterium]